MTAATKAESENEESKMEAVRAKSSVVSDENSQLEVLSKQIVTLMSAIGSKSFMKPHNGRCKISKCMK